MCAAALRNARRARCCPIRVGRGGKANVHCILDARVHGEEQKEKGGEHRAGCGPATQALFCTSDSANGSTSGQGARDRRSSAGSAAERRMHGAAAPAPPPPNSSTRPTPPSPGLSTPSAPTRA